MMDGWKKEKERKRKDDRMTVVEKNERLGGAKMKENIEG